MKKFNLFFIAVFSFAFLANAQDDCMGFYPNTEGSTLVSNTYDASNNLLSIMTTKVNNSYDYFSGSEIDMSFTITDSNNTIIDRGTIEANCMDGNFYLNMKNRSMDPDIIKTLGNHTELIGSFLDYPDPFGSDIPGGSPFTMTGGEFTIKSKTDKNENLSSRVFNRQYMGNEKITTPAGTFDAGKIEFLIETHSNNQTLSRKGIEWYAAGAGIVRTEIYDENNNLLSYTVLVSRDVK